MLTSGPIRTFLRAEHGNTAMIFGLCAMVILTAGGGAIDFARAVDARTRMAAALDAAALAVGSSSRELSNSDVQALAQKYFDANYSGNMVNTPSPVQVSGGGGNVVSLSVSGDLPTTLLKIAGINTLSIGVNNEVTRAHVPKKMQIVLALDNTGSMAQSGKMTALKTASHNLLDTLEDAVEADGDIRVSIVPFAREVNVDKANLNQPWIKWTDWNSNNGNWVCSDWDDGDCRDWDWVAANHNTWNGCVMDRDQNYDTKNTTPTAGNAATLFWAKQSPYCPTKVLPLTSTWSSLHSKVDAMNPVGNTNTTIGLVWGWQALTGGAPLSAPAVTEDTYRIIIFMTDGDNTQNRWTTNQAAIDARMQIACTNVKNDDIILYTILMIQGDEPLLKSCATDASKFFKITEANQIINVFEAIGTELANLHLSK
jgi:Flp pilus assembly protein TadG